MNPNDQPSAPQPTPVSSNDPNTFFQPVVPVQPQVINPVSPNNPVGEATQASSMASGNMHSSGQNSKKKLMIIVAAVIGVIFLVAIVAGLLLANSQPKTKKTVKTADTNQVGGPSAATSSSVQQSDDAISQYLSSLDDNKDFPAKALDNTTLGLQ